MNTEPKNISPKFTITVVCNVKPICLDYYSNPKEVLYTRELYRVPPPIMPVNKG
jgi:hypothetical protein